MGCIDMFLLKGTYSAFFCQSHERSCKQMLLSPTETLLLKTAVLISIYRYPHMNAYKLFTFVFQDCISANAFALQMNNLHACNPSPARI